MHLSELFLAIATLCVLSQSILNAFSLQTLKRIQKKVTHIDIVVFVPLYLLAGSVFPPFGEGLESFFLAIFLGVVVGRGLSALLELGTCRIPAEERE